MPRRNGNDVLGRKKKTAGALTAALKVMMTPELLAGLEKEAALRGLSLSAYVRHEMTLTLERHQAERAGKAGKKVDGGR